MTSRYLRLLSSTKALEFGGLPLNLDPSRNGSCWVHGPWPSGVPLCEGGGAQIPPSLGPLQEGCCQGGTLHNPCIPGVQLEATASWALYSPSINSPQGFPSTPKASLDQDLYLSRVSRDLHVSLSHVMLMSWSKQGAKEQPRQQLLLLLLICNLED